MSKILSRKADSIGYLTFNNPERHNAVSLEMWDSVEAVLQDFVDDDDIRVIVITGAGGKAFVSGADISKFDTERGSHEAVLHYNERVKQVYNAIAAVPKPTIAMINGDCFGGAFSIVEGCDLAVVANEARLGLSEINFKIFPGGAVSKSLANLLRPREALFYGLTGRPFDGVEAARIGLVNYAVPKAELREYVMDLATDIAAKDGDALRATKDGYKLALEMSWEASMDYTLAKQDQLTLHQHGAWQDQGIGNFLDKKYKPGLESQTS